MEMKLDTYCILFFLNSNLFATMSHTKSSMPETDKTLQNISSLKVSLTLKQYLNFFLFENSHLDTHFGIVDELSKYDSTDFCVV